MSTSFQDLYQNRRLNSIMFITSNYFCKFTLYELSTKVLICQMNLIGIFFICLASLKQLNVLIIACESYYTLLFFSILKVLCNQGLINCFTIYLYFYSTKNNCSSKTPFSEYHNYFHFYFAFINNGSFDIKAWVTRRCGVFAGFCNGELIFLVESSWQFLGQR